MKSNLKKGKQIPYTHTYCETKEGMWCTILNYRERIVARVEGHTGNETIIRIYTRILDTDEYVPSSVTEHIVWNKSKQQWGKVVKILSVPTPLRDEAIAAGYKKNLPGYIKRRYPNYWNIIYDHGRSAYPVATVKGIMHYIKSLQVIRIIFDLKDHHSLHLKEL